MFSIDSTDLEAGLERVDDKIAAVSKVASDMTPLWPRVGEVFAEHQRSIFSSGHDWAPLERSTMLKKGSSQVLIERGVLMQAATSPRPVEANRLYAKFGLTHSQVPYAHWHARGAGVPERDPVPKLPPSVIQMMLDKVAERIREELAR